MDKEKILNLILSEIYNATTSDDILIYDEKNGRFLVCGEVLPPNKSQEIIEAAEELNNNILFQFLIRELEYEGTRRMAIKAVDLDGMRFPKANMWTAQLLRDKVNTIRNLSVKKVATKEKK